MARRKSNREAKVPLTAVSVGIQVRRRSAPQALFHFHVCRILVQFGKYFDCILMTAGSKSSQFISIPSLASQLDQLVNRVLVASLCLLPQFRQIGIGHGQTSCAFLTQDARYPSYRRSSEVITVKWVP